MNPVNAPALFSRHGVFDRLIARCRGAGTIPVAVAAPSSEVALLGAIEAAREGLIDPILVGPHRALEELARGLGVDLAQRRVVDARDDLDAAAKAVQLCRSGEARAL